MVSYNEATTEELIEILKDYVDEEYENIIDLQYVAKHGKEDTDWEDVTFTLLFGKVILNTKDLSYKDALPELPIEEPTEEEEEEGEEEEI